MKLKYLFKRLYYKIYYKIKYGNHINDMYLCEIYDNFDNYKLLRNKVIRFTDLYIYLTLLPYDSTTIAIKRIKNNNVKK